MDVQEKSHAALNYAIGVTGITSPFWMDAINIAEYWLHFLTVLCGFLLVAYQLINTYNKRNGSGD